MVTDAQVRLLRRRRMEGKTLKAAAAAAGMSERAARAWQRGPLPSQMKKARWWRTRRDPFEQTWESDVEPMLRADERGVLEAKTVLEVLAERYPDGFNESHLRTLQRRMRHWRALQGPPREVRFEQVHPPGREAQFDFTDCTALAITILGQPFAHLWFELKLMFSGWCFAMLAFSETFEALVAGVQAAFWKLDGVVEVVRHDNLSAATRELRRTGGRTLTRRFADVLAHYGLRSTRIEPGESHQNGGAEKAHDILKRAIDQALVLRGSRDFESAAAYVAFVQSLIDKRNAKTAALLAQEVPTLRPLPTMRLPEYTTHHPHVTCWSTITVGKRIYSVPSRLMGHDVEARLHPDVVEVCFAGKTVETFPRLRGERENHRIDYRHIIWSLVRKPAAFARYKYREDLFPSLVFRKAYDQLQSTRGERADVEYVRVLHLAASTMEARVEKTLAELLARGEPFDYARVRELASPEQPSVPALRVVQPNLVAYDALIRVGGTQ
jgi:hypothetical protein